MKRQPLDHTHARSVDLANGDAMKHFQDKLYDFKSCMDNFKNNSKHGLFSIE